MWQVSQSCCISWNMCHLIHYRGGKDSIGFHSDTWLDLMPGSTIGVVSLGATRLLEMREKVITTNKILDNNCTLPKFGKGEQQVKLDAGSLFILDETTNAKWTHGIRKVRNRIVWVRILLCVSRFTKRNERTPALPLYFDKRARIKQSMGISLVILACSRHIVQQSTPARKIGRNKSNKTQDLNACANLRIVESGITEEWWAF